MPASTELLHMTIRSSHNLNVRLVLPGGVSAGVLAFVMGCLR